MCCPSTKPTQSCWDIFPEVHILPSLLDIWPRLDLAQPSSGHVQLDTLSAKIPRCSITDNWNTWIASSLLLHDKNFTHWHQTSLFYSQKSLLVLNVTKEFNTVPKLRIGRFGRWHSQQESLRNHWNLVLKEKLPIMDSGCSALLKWAPR